MGVGPLAYRRQVEMDYCFQQLRLDGKHPLRGTKPATNEL